MKVNISITGFLFPYTVINHTKRSHNGNILKNNEEHHVSPIISCIALIPDINITSLFSLHYMHLVCLSVMKNAIYLWTNNGSLSVRLSSWKVKQLSLNLEKMRISITNDY